MVSATSKIKSALRPEDDIKTVSAGDYLRDTFNDPKSKVRTGLYHTRFTLADVELI